MLASSPDTFALCKSILQANYFDPEYRQTVAFIQNYYDKYNALPAPMQIKAETGLTINPHVVTRDQAKYCADEIESFCRLEAIKDAVRRSMKLMHEGDYGSIEREIRNAISVSLTKDLGINYFQDPASRLARFEQTATRIPTGWPSLDEQLGGGMARTEILLVSANSGGGKSITLANYGVNMLERGLNVLYITLELAEYLVAQRFDTMYTGISAVVWKQRKNELIRELEQAAAQNGNLTIKHMPAGTNSNQIRSYLKEYELANQCVPDVMIVDYLDIMGTNEKVSADNVSEKDKRATEQLREIGFDFDMIVATASQQNRAAVDAPDLNQSHIAGGMTKVNTVDVWASIIFTAPMRALGQISFKLLKTRNSDGVGNTVNLGWVPNKLRIVSDMNQRNVQSVQKVVDSSLKPADDDDFDAFSAFAQFDK